MRKLSIAAVAIVLGLAAGTDAMAKGRRSDPAWKAAHGRTSPVAPDTGGLCPTPPVVAAVPFNDTGNTCTSSTNAITNYGGVCATMLPFPYPGPELIYRLNLGAGNNLAFSADLTGSTGDLALFFVGSACGVGTNCVANSQDAIGPGAGPEVIAAASYTPGTYYLYIDSYYGGANPARCGSYNLSITGILPVELIQFSAE